MECPRYRKQSTIYSSITSPIHHEENASLCGRHHLQKPNDTTENTSMQR